MAAAATSTQSPCSWTIDGFCEVVVCNHDPMQTDAKVILDCFVTDRQHVELKTFRKDGILHVHFPVPLRTQTHSRETLKETFAAFMRTYVNIEYNIIAVPIPKIQNWEKAEFYEILLKEFLQEVRRISHLVKLMFCARESRSFDEAVKICNKVIGVGHPKPISSKHSKIHRPSIQIVKGSLDEMKADAITCTMSSSLDLTKGAASKALLKRAGSELQHELHRKHPNGVKFGEIAVIAGHKLNCKRVYFGVMGPWRKEVCPNYEGEEHYYRASINDFMVMCLGKARESKIKSIAFPAIGSGNLQYPLEIVADQMFKTANNWIEDKEQPHLEKILFVIYPQDGVALQAFQDVEKDLVQSTKKSSPLKEPRAVEYSPRSEASNNFQNDFTKTGKMTEGSWNKTTVKYVENPERTESQTVKRTIELPSSKSTTVVQYFIAETLKRLQDQGFSVSTTDNKVCIKGKVEDIEEGMKELMSAVEAVDSSYNETLNFSSSTKITNVHKEVNQIEEYMDVCCIINDKRKAVTVYGKNMKNVLEAKSELEKGLMGTVENNDASKTSGNIRQQTTTNREPTKSKPGIGRSLSLSDSENYKMFLTKENIKIKVYSAYIVQLSVDCIVNAANINLAHGGGIAKAIEKAAGKDLTKEGYEYLKSHGKLKVGEACFTGPGKLPHKLVIHAVGPCWSDYAPHSQEMVDKCELDLYNAVINSLSLAERKGMQTIAIPAISSGIYGCPVDVCCVQYGKAVIHYSQLSKCPLQEIHFVDIKKGIVCDIQDTFKVMIQDGNIPSTHNKEKYTVKQTGRDKKNIKDACDKQLQSPKNNAMRSDDNKSTTQSMRLSDRNRSSWQGTSSVTLLAGHPYESSSQPPGHYKKSYTCTVGQGQNIYIYSTSLLTLTGIDMIACSEVPKGVGQGKVSQKLLELGGGKYKSEKKKAFSSAVKPGDIVFCKGGQSNFKWIAHAILNPWNSPGKFEDIWQTVSNIYEDIFHGMMTQKCRSLALPLLGTGKGKADPKSCAHNLFDSLMMFCSKNKSYKFDIHIVHMESEKTKMAIGVLKRMVQNLVTDASPTTSFSSSQRRTNGAHSTKGRPVSASFHQESKPHRQVNGSGSIDARRPSRGRKPSNNQTGFDNRKEKGIPRHVVYEKNYTFRQQKTSDKRHSDVEDQHYYPEEEFQQEEVAVSNDSDSSLDDKGSSENSTGNLRVFEVSKTDRQTDNSGNNKTESEESTESHDRDGTNHDVSDEESDKDDNNVKENAETCVICMEDITDPQKLSCGHIFCAECIQEQFTYKQACPTCGKVCGIIKGDQPYGRMDIVINNRASCVGFEDSGRIEITYKFPDGTQEDNHPCPGKRFKGITRTAYLPNNRKGREICDMLKVAFKRKLVFTIGSSRTTGADGVITWNDIHHKTDPKPNSQFGYPDSTYLDRVTEELQVKGVTVNDIPSGHAAKPRHR